MNFIKRFPQWTLLLVLIGFIATSCSDKKQLTNKLEGTWDAESVDGSGDDANKTNSTSVTISATNAGQYNFKDDGTGSFTLEVTIEVEQDQGGVQMYKNITTTGDFNWDNTDSTIIIDYTSGSNKGKKVRLNIENETDNKIKVSGNNQTDLFVHHNTSISNKVLDLNVDFTMTLVKQ